MPVFFVSGQGATSASTLAPPPHVLDYNTFILVLGGWTIAFCSTVIMLYGPSQVWAAASESCLPVPVCHNAMMRIPAIWATVVGTAPSLFTAVLVQLSKCLAEFTLNIINILHFYNTI